MASGTWNNATENGDWSNAGNWSGVAAPGAGETATFDGTEAALGLPDGTDNEPSSGAISIVVSGSAAYSFDIVTELFNSKGATIGAVTLNDASSSITAGGNVGGAIIVTAGTFSMAASENAASTIDVANSATMDFTGTGTCTVADDLTLASGGTLTVGIGTIVDLAAAKSLVGTAGATAVTNGGTIKGIVNLSGGCSWSGTGIVEITDNSTLNFGMTTDNSQTVDIAADVTIGASFRCHALDGSSGVITGADKTVKVGAGGLDWGAATLDAPGTLNIEVAAGETTTVLKTTTVLAHRLGTLTISGTATASGLMVVSKFAGDGTLHLNNQTLAIAAAVNDFWTFSGTLDGSGYASFTYYSTTSVENNYPITAGGTIDINIVPGGNGVVITQKAAMSCRDLLVRTISDTAGHVGSLVISGAPLTVRRDTYLGYLTRGGNLTLAAGQTNTLGGDIIRSGTATANAITFAGNVSLAGNATLAGITADFGSAYINGAVTIDGASAGTVANASGVIAQATIANLTAPAANPVYVYKHNAEKQLKDSRFPNDVKSGLDGFISTGNTNVLAALITRDGEVGGGIRRTKRGRRTKNVGRSRWALARD